MSNLLDRFGIALLLAIPLGALAQPYAIDWHTIDGGGGSSTGGNYALSGTIGQADASTATLTGGNYTLQGGFWPGLTVTIPGGGPTLLIEPSNGSVIVSWSPNTPGFALEQTDDLATPVWVPVPDGTNHVVLPAGVATRFYRLIKP